MDTLCLAPLHHLEETLRKARAASYGRGDQFRLGSTCIHDQSPRPQNQQPAIPAQWARRPGEPSARPARHGARSGPAARSVTRARGPASPQGRPGARGGGLATLVSRSQAAPGPKTPVGSTVTLQRVLNRSSVHW